MALRYRLNAHSAAMCKYLRSISVVFSLVEKVEIYLPIKLINISGKYLYANTAIQFSFRLTTEKAN